MNDEGDVLQVQRLDEALEVLRMVEESVGDVRLVGSAHADEVGRDGTSHRGDVGDDVAPQIGRGRIAMQKQNGIPLALVDVVHLRAMNLHVLGLERELGRDRLLRSHLQLLVKRLGSSGLGDSGVSIAGPLPHGGPSGWFAEGRRRLLRLQCWAATSSRHRASTSVHYQGSCAALDLAPPVEPPERTSRNRRWH